ncbi:hypothetical protein Q75_12320 [Bacillus coahuilensis p1.1.43]|uniref:Uncharacterized protein n=1 Tax=Bacillus coahuilensis p1.1.43 TaxID=1150625 RepID=A0A147K643_9BACI|nr:hypothetical protein [Bacillus coahuilensis]KUP05311.1 hypothetical protein Q75_12320 [Bacillus coahuilensis p1.1.43]
MTNSLLVTAHERSTLYNLQQRIQSNTYEENDFKALFSMLLNYSNELSMAQTKKLCELVEYFHVVKREDRLPEIISSMVDFIVSSTIHDESTYQSFVIS